MPKYLLSRIDEHDFANDFILLWLSYFIWLCCPASITLLLLPHVILPSLDVMQHGSITLGRVLIMLAFIVFVHICLSSPHGACTLSDFIMQ